MSCTQHNLIPFPVSRVSAPVTHAAPAPVARLTRLSSSEMKARGATLALQFHSAAKAPPPSEHELGDLVNEAIQALTMWRSGERRSVDLALISRVILSAG